MRLLNTVLMAGLFIGMVAQSSKSQNLYIQKTDGSVVTEPLSSVATLTFATTDLNVNFATGTTDVYALSDIRKLYFTANVTADEPLEANTQACTIYPNPAKDHVVVNNETGSSQLLRIYHYNGQLVMNQQVPEGKTTLSLCNLNPGFYLVQVGEFTLKLIRQ